MFDQRATSIRAAPRSQMSVLPIDPPFVGRTSACL